MADRQRRKFTPEFKEKIVQLYISGGGKPRKEIIAEYGLTLSSFDKWVNQHSNSASYREKDNKPEEQLEIERLLKEN